MEFIKKNHVNTTSSISVDSGTLTVKNIINFDETFQYVTEDFNNDLTTGSVTYSFDETLTVDRIILRGMNLKDFTIFYDGVTANTFAMTTTAATTTSDWSSNSETAMFIRTTAVDVTSVTIDMSGTIVADSEKAIGYFSVSELKLDFPQIPAANGYKPVLKPQEVVHRMSDGSTRVHFIEEHWGAKIKFKHIPTSFRDDLKTVHGEKRKFAFAAFGTTTSWDEVFFECVWPGSFNFYQYTDNNTDVGFKGDIDLRGA